MKKPMLFGAIALALVAIIVGLGVSGTVNIPGLTPKKKVPNNLYGAGAERLYAEVKEPAVPRQAAKKLEQVVEKKKTEPRLDELKGAKKVAKLWNVMEPQRVADIAKTWKDEELAQVLSVMQAEQAALVLSAMQPERAAKLSREIGRLASLTTAPPQGS
jgi:flagellar motility protein MotE (MotC chaperone)